MAEHIKKLTMRNCCIDEDGRTDEPIIKKLNEVIDFINSINAAPVRHAKWGVEVGMNFFKERNCPVCKKRIESNFWNFCPNCGAKMDGGNNDD